MTPGANLSSSSSSTPSTLSPSSSAAALVAKSLVLLETSADRAVAPCKHGRYRLWLVVLSVGVASHFQLYLDSVMDNVLPAAMPFLKTIYASKDDADEAWELTISARIYGLALGCLLSACCPYRLGYKLPLVSGTLLAIVGVLLTSMVVYLPWGMMPAIVGRFLNGVGHGLTQTAGSAFLSEVPPIQSRGKALATLTMFACLGELLGLAVSLDGLLGAPGLWHWAMAFPLLPLLPSFGVLLWASSANDYEASASGGGGSNSSSGSIPVSGSVRHHDINCNTGQANNNNNNNNNSDNDSSVTSALAAAAAAGSAAYSPIAKPNKPSSRANQWWWTQLSDGRFLCPLIIALVIQTFVHLDDWLWLSYSTPIFERHGLPSGAAQLASLLMAVPQAILSIALIFCFDHFSRRSLIVYSTLGSVGAAGLAGIISAASPNPSGGGLVSVAVPFLASVDLGFAAAAGEAAYAVVPELFLPQHKVVAGAAAGILQNVSGGAITNVLLTSINRHGFAVVLFPFVVANMAYALFTHHFLPETAFKTPQEVSLNFPAELRPLTWLRDRLLPLRIPSRRSLVNMIVFLLQVTFVVVILRWLFAYTAVSATKPVLSDPPRPFL